MINFVNTNGNPTKVKIPLLEGDKPEKGKQYFTDTDKQEMVDEITKEINFFHTYNGEMHFAKLPDFQEYKVFYKDENRELKECGQCEIKPKNMISEIAFDTEGNVFNEVGYIKNRDYGSTGKESNSGGKVLSGYIDLPGLSHNLILSGNGITNLMLFDKNYTLLTAQPIGISYLLGNNTSTANDDGVIITNGNIIFTKKGTIMLFGITYSNVEYLRFSTVNNGTENQIYATLVEK